MSRFARVSDPMLCAAKRCASDFAAPKRISSAPISAADCDETAPEGEPSSTAELLRQCAALLLFGSEKTEMLEFSPDFYELNGSAKVEQMRT